MRSNKVVYLVEGETEEKFIKSKLKNARNPKGKIYNGSVHKFNPFQEKNIRKILRHLDKSKTTILIIDTDLDEDNKYQENISEISKASKELKLLKQKVNFEDEMSYICSIRNDQLYHAFGAVSPSEFKNKYLKTKTLISDKFPSSNVDLYCSRYPKMVNKKYSTLFFSDLYE